MSKQSDSWSRFIDFITYKLGKSSLDDAKKIDLHDSSLSIRARRGYCGDHGEVVAYDFKGQYQCWCGDTVVLKCEVDKHLEKMAIQSMSTDPTWRC